MAGDTIVAGQLQVTRELWLLRSHRLCHRINQAELKTPTESPCHFTELSRVTEHDTRGETRLAPEILLNGLSESFSMIAATLLRRQKLSFLGAFDQRPLRNLTTVKSVRASNRCLSMGNLVPGYGNRMPLGIAHHAHLGTLAIDEEKRFNTAQKRGCFGPHRFCGKEITKSRGMSLIYSHQR